MNTNSPSSFSALSQVEQFYKVFENAQKKEDGKTTSIGVFLRIKGNHRDADSYKYITVQKRSWLTKFICFFWKKEFQGDTNISALSNLLAKALQESKEKSLSAEGKEHLYKMVNWHQNIVSRYAKKHFKQNIEAEKFAQQNLYAPFVGISHTLINQANKNPEPLSTCAKINLGTFNNLLKNLDHISKKVFENLVKSTYESHADLNIQQRLTEIQNIYTNSSLYCTENLEYQLVGAQIPQLKDAYTKCTDATKFSETDTYLDTYKQLSKKISAVEQRITKMPLNSPPQLKKPHQEDSFNPTTPSQPLFPLPPVNPEKDDEITTPTKQNRDSDNSQSYITPQSPSSSISIPTPRLLSFKDGDSESPITLPCDQPTVNRQATPFLLKNPKRSLRNKKITLPKRRDQRRHTIHGTSNLLKNPSPLAYGKNPTLPPFPSSWTPFKPDQDVQDTLPSNSHTKKRKSQRSSKRRKIIFDTPSSLENTKIDASSPLNEELLSEEEMILKEDEKRVQNQLTEANQLFEKSFKKTYGEKMGEDELLTVILENSNSSEKIVETTNTLKTLTNSINQTEDDVYRSFFWLCLHLFSKDQKFIENQLDSITKASFNELLTVPFFNDRDPTIVESIALINQKITDLIDFSEVLCTDARKATNLASWFSDQITTCNRDILQLEEKIAEKKKQIAKEDALLAEIDLLKKTMQMSNKEKSALLTPNRPSKEHYHFYQQLGTLQTTIQNGTEAQSQLATYFLAALTYYKRENRRKSTLHETDSDIETFEYNSNASDSSHILDLLDTAVNLLENEKDTLCLDKILQKIISCNGFQNVDNTVSILQNRLLLLSSGEEMIKEMGAPNTNFFKEIAKKIRDERESITEEIYTLLSHALSEAPLDGLKKKTAEWLIQASKAPLAKRTGIRRLQGPAGQRTRGGGRPPKPRLAINHLAKTTRVLLEGDEEKIVKQLSYLQESGVVLPNLS